SARPVVADRAAGAVDVAGERVVDPSAAGDEERCRLVVLDDRVRDDAGAERVDGERADVVDAAAGRIEESRLRVVVGDQAVRDRGEAGERSDAAAVRYDESLDRVVAN